MIDEATVIAAKLGSEGAIKIDTSGCSILVEEKILPTFDIKAVYCCLYEYL